MALRLSLHSKHTGFTVLKIVFTWEALEWLPLGSSGKRFTVTWF